MSIETDRPAMTCPMSEALIGALSSWPHPTYEDQEHTSE